MASFSHFNDVDSPEADSAVMKWTAFNAFGGLAWLAGLSVAKTATIPEGNIFLSSDHHLLAGVSIGAMGLAVLIWSNLQASG